MRRNAARSRTALVSAAAGFTALQAGLALLILLRLPDLRDPLYHDRATPLAVRSAGRPVTVVALGTSRTADGFRARVVERELFGDGGGVAFNFGVPGAGPVSRLIYLRRLLRAGVRPDLLLVEVFPPTMNEVGLPLDLSRLTGERLNSDEVALVADFGGAEDELTAGWAASWLLPWHAHRDVLLLRLSYFLDGCKPNPDPSKRLDAWGEAGQRRRPATPRQADQLRERARAEYAGVFKRWTLSEPQCRAYREMLRLCRGHGIPAVLVWMPEGPEFRSQYPPGAGSRIRAFLGELSEEFGVPLINARTWLGEDEFSDSHHLLPAGAERFSTRLAAELRPLVRREEAR